MNTINRLYIGEYRLLPKEEKQNIIDQLRRYNDLGGDDERCSNLHEQLMDSRTYLEVAYDKVTNKLMASCGYKKDFAFENVDYMEKGYSFRESSFDKQIFYKMNYKILNQLKEKGYGLNKVISKIRPENIASIKFTNKGGFIFLTTLPWYRPINVYIWSKEPNYV